MFSLRLLFCRKHVYSIKVCFFLANHCIIFECILGFLLLEGSAGVRFLEAVEKLYNERKEKFDKRKLIICVCLNKQAYAQLLRSQVSDNNKQVQRRHTHTTQVVEISQKASK